MKMKILNAIGQLIAYILIIFLITIIMSREKEIRELEIQIATQNNSDDSQNTELEKRVYQLDITIKEHIQEAATKDLQLELGIQGLHELRKWDQKTKAQIKK